MKKVVALFAFICVYSIAISQTDPVKNDLFRFNRPTTSQRSEISQKIGLSFIKVNYGRPNLKGRTIFGGLLEYGKIWRMGADYQTIIDFQNEYVIQGDTISSGKYVLYAIPNKDNWTIYLNNDLKGWGHYTYNPENNIYSFETPVEQSPEFTETFTIGFMNTTLNQGELYFQWENVRAKLPITISENHRRDIDNNFNFALGLNKRRVGYRYYLASEYLFTEDKNFTKALEYIQKAIDSGVKAFYTYYLKGEILYKMGKYEDAVKSAQKAQKNLQEDISNPEWERKIKNAIIDWSN